MAFIPESAKWYLADLVERITVEGDRRDVVHVNLVLIRADSPEQAYTKALARGREADSEYTNSEGQRVRCEFLGLRDLNVVHGALEDGVELAFTEYVAPPPDDVARWLCPREKLGVFAPIDPSTNPDYADGETVAQAHALMRGSRPPGGGTAS